jgi:hypothetical protein
LQLTVKHLLRMLASESDLLELLFAKRDDIVGYSQAQEFSREGGIERLSEGGLLVSDGSAVALDEDLRTFLETVLDSGGEIEIGNIGELLDEIGSKILLFNKSDSFEQQQKYIKRIERILKKIPQMISKSLVKLHQHIHMTYKSADAYELKRTELQYYKEKLELLIAIDTRIETTLNHEAPFFRNRVPQSTTHLYYDLKSHLMRVRISLVDLQRQVVDYINRVSPDVGFFRHISRLKQLKNAYEIREYTNIAERAREGAAPLALMPKLMFSTQLEREYAFSVDFAEYVEGWFRRRHTPLPERQKAEAIDASYLEEEAVEEFVVDTEALHREFTQSDADLFGFIMAKSFGFEQDFEARLSLYCDMAGLYAKEYWLGDDFGAHDGYEYLMIYAKEQ